MSLIKKKSQTLVRNVFYGFRVGSRIHEYLSKYCPDNVLAEFDYTLYTYT